MSKNKKINKIDMENREFLYELVSNDITTLYEFTSCLTYQGNITKETSDHLCNIFFRFRENIDKMARELDIPMDD